MHNNKEQHKIFEARRFSQACKPDDERTAYAHDKGRVIHSFTFRRLQNKTQVSAPSEGDFHRTRLTHSLEVAQIGEGICDTLCAIAQRQEAHEWREWLPTHHLITTACYCHDLGHPPFGHEGEEALHSNIQKFSENEDKQSVRKYGGFESNAHTMRIVTRLEPYLTHKNTNGMNLTRRTLLAILKYPVSYAQYTSSEQNRGTQKCYFESEREYIDWMSEPFVTADQEQYRARPHPESNNDFIRTLDASIMDIADEIAYSTHDLEDAIFLGRLSMSDIRNAREQAEQQLDTNQSKLADVLTNARIEELFQNDARRKNMISYLIHTFITNIEVRERPTLQHPLLRYYVALPQVLQALLSSLRRVVWERVIRSTERMKINIRNTRMIDELFELYYKHGHQIIPDYQVQLEQNTDITKHENMAKLRVITDYLAGLSDASLMHAYQELR